MMTKKREVEPSEILAILSSGESVSDGETEELVERLSQALTSENPDDWDFDEIYEICLVLGRLRAKSAVPLLERLLDAQEPMTLSLVLHILCVDWGLCEYYLERVLTFAVGAVWDEEHDVQEKAIEILGSYVKRKNSEQPQGKPSGLILRVLDLLWQLFISGEEPTVVRVSAYSSILGIFSRAANLPSFRELTTIVRSLPEISSVESLPETLDRESLNKLRKLLHAA